MATQSFYPNLGTIVSVDNFPEELQFLENGIQQILDKMYYKDLQYTKSVDASTAYYDVTLVTNEALKVDLFGTGLSLVFNPGNSGETVIPLILHYRWGILALIKDFNLQNFSYLPADIKNILDQIVSLGDSGLMQTVVQVFESGEDLLAYQSLVDKINQAYNLTGTEQIPYPTDSDPVDMAEDIRQAIETSIVLTATVPEVVDQIYITSTDPSTYLQNLDSFLFNIVGESAGDYIKKIIIPQLDASLELSLGLAFPRKMLKPVDPNDAGQSMLIFDIGSLEFSTQGGIGFQEEMSVSLQPISQVGNTGLGIEIQKVKLDLSRTENINEAYLDGRSEDFMGVYAEKVAITLPQKWFNQETGQTLAIIGERLLIGNGGISGTLGLRATHAIDAGGMVSDYYSEYFHFQYPITALSNGTEESLTSDTELLAHINTLAKTEDLRFKFPLTVITDQTIDFDTASEYNQFISSIDPDKFMWFALGSNPNKTWRLGFNHFDLTFRQGEVVGSNLKARLEIPKFKDPDSPDPDAKAIIDLEGHWYSQEDFSLTANFLPSGFPLTLFDFMTINFLSAELGKDSGRFFLGTSCEVWFQNPIMNKLLDDQKISLPNMRIYEDGSMEIVGGNTFIPLNLSLNLGPIDVAVTGVHFGSHQQEYNGVMRKYNYWGFDGAISIDPLGIDARGEGVKYYYTVDNDEHGGSGDSFLHIQTIEVDLIIPGTADPKSALAIINGMVSVPSPGESPEYTGKISLELPKIDVAGSAAIRLNPKSSSFLIDASIELPKPIPVGPLGIYGFSGLLGFKYVAEKEAVGLVSGEDTWYDYYTYPPRGIHVSKFSGPERTSGYSAPVSLGAGGVLGTLGDDGTSIAIRAMVLLSLPTLLAIDGRASILGERPSLSSTEEPPFFAFVFWGDSSIEFGMGADFQLPKSGGNKGDLVDLYAKVEAAFFFNNPSAWYINFGTKEEPITAKVLKLVTTQTYLMISGSGIEAGARAEFELKKRFGPAKVHLYAYLEIGGFISFERPQIGGYLALGGIIDIDIWIVGISISLDAILSVEATKPFLLYAALDLRVCVKIVFAKVCKSFTVELKWERNTEVDKTPIAALPFAGDGGNKTDRTKESVQGVHMLSNESFELNYLGQTVPSNAHSIDKILPLDTYIDIKMVKGLIPTAISGKIGGHTGGADNYTDLIPPDRVVRGGKEIRQVKHKYSINSIAIKAWTGSQWIDYHPFEAVLEASERSNVSNLPIGYWQRSGNQYDAIRLLGTNPLNFLDAGQPGSFIPEQYGITPSELFCAGTLRNLTCANVLNKTLGTKYYIPTQYTAHYINGAYFTIEGAGTTMIVNHSDGSQTIVEDTSYLEISNPANSFNFAQSLVFDPSTPLVIIFPNPVVKVSLKLNTEMEGVTIHYYKSEGLQDNQVVYTEVYQEYKTATELHVKLDYTNENDAISKIVIRPKPLDLAEISSIQAQMAELLDDAYSNATGVVSGEPVPSENQDTYQQLKDRLNIATLAEITEPPCNMDEALCALHDNLKQNLENCISNPPIGGGEGDPVLCNFYTQTKNNLDNCIVYETESLIETNYECFNNFNTAIANFSATNGEYGLMDSLGDNLGTLMGLLEGGNDENFETIVNLSTSILNTIQTQGNCGESSTPPFPEWSCFELFHTDIQNFHHNHPSYQLLNSIGTDLDTLMNYPNTDPSPNLLGAQQYSNTILEKIKELGDCDCIDPEPSPKTDFTTSLQEVCWMSVEDFEYNATIPSQAAVEQEQQNMQDAVEKTIQPIWRPNTEYYIHFQVQDEVDDGANTGTFDYYYGFKTAGPVGHFHNAIGVDYGNEYDQDGNIINRKDSDGNLSLTGKLVNSDNYPLTSLRQYIDYERSYPNANGNLLQAKPLFYGHEQCKISIYFSYPLAYHMVNTWFEYNNLPELLGEMHIAIKDPISNVVIPYPLPVDYTEDTVPLPSITWEDDNDPRIPVNLQVLNNFIEHITQNNDAIDCTLALGQAISPNSKVYTVTFTNLKARKLYTALLYNAFDKNASSNLENTESEQIHRFVFQTSRYANFREQIESYILKDVDEDGSILNQRNAIFDIPVEGLDSIAIDTLYDIVVNNANSHSDALAQSYQHLFDRAIEGVLGMKPLEVAENTEFNILKNADTGEAFAILIRNPEPFNIPKIPLTEIQDTIQVMQDASTVDDTYKVLHSKDYSQVLIMPESKKIEVNALSFRFQYKTWNGSTYQVDNTNALSSILLENIQINA